MTRHVLRLDHIHLRVPDRTAAAQWYATHLGFEPVDEYRFWAEGFEGGPLQISCDGGATTLALFEASTGHPMVPFGAGVAFGTDADSFIEFARSLPSGIESSPGVPLVTDDIVDLDLCWSYEFADPWGNGIELSTREYERVRTELVIADGLTPQRFWPADAIENWHGGDAEPR